MPGVHFSTAAETATGSLALFVGLAGVSEVSDVGANGVIAYLSQSGGGVTDIVYANNEVHIINNSGRKQKILAITPVPPATSVASTAELCSKVVDEQLMEAAYS